MMLSKPRANGELLGFCFILQRALRESKPPITDPALFGQLVAAAQEPERETPYLGEVATLWMKGYALPEPHVCDAMVALFSDTPRGEQLQQCWEKASKVEPNRMLGETLLVINGWANRHRLRSPVLIRMLGEHGYEGHTDATRLHHWLSGSEPIPASAMNAFGKMMAAPVSARISARGNDEKGRG